MIDRFRRLREATQEAVLRGPGSTPAALRQAVAAGDPPPELQPLVTKIHRHAFRVTDEDLASLADRFDADQRFEIAIAAAVGAADARRRAAVRALEEA